MRKLWILALWACEDETPKPTMVPVPRFEVDATPRPEAGNPDARLADARVGDARVGDAALDARVGDARVGDAALDAQASDARASDAAPALDAMAQDARPADAAPRPDAAELDRAVPDLAPIDLAPPPPDLAPVDLAPPPLDQGLPPGVRPCALGPGTTLFAVHWDGGERPDVDHWAAACEYGFNINGCGAFARCGDAIANCGVAVVDGGQGLLLDGIDDLLFRFHVNGLAFNDATLYFQARGTRGQGNLEIFSPIYGGLEGPVAGNQVYAWYEVPWGDFLSPADDPGVTAIRFRARGGGPVAIHAVELCIR